MPRTIRDEDADNECTVAIKDVRAKRAAVEAGEPSYQKPDGTPCTLEWLVRNEPEWAANRIRVGHRHLRERDEALAEIARLKQRMEMDAAERALLALVPKGPQP